MLCLNSWVWFCQYSVHLLSSCTLLIVCYTNRTKNIRMNRTLNYLNKGTIHFSTIAKAVTCNGTSDGQLSRIVLLPLNSTCFLSPAVVLYSFLLSLRQSCDRFRALKTESTLTINNIQLHVIRSVVAVEGRVRTSTEDIVISNVNTFTTSTLVPTWSLYSEQVIVTYYKY